MNNPIHVKQILLNVEKDLMSIKDYRSCLDWLGFYRVALDAVMRLQREAIVGQLNDSSRRVNAAKSYESEEIESNEQ